MSKIELGLVNGIKIWDMPTFPDIRGNLLKSYVGGESGSFEVDFNVKEHFFTVSKKNVFRGMHFQGEPHSVSKIISLVQGEAIDFLLDTRKDSETYRHVQIQELNLLNPVSIFIPPGVAHGYLSLCENTIISYKMDGYFCGNCDGGIRGEIVREYLPIEFATIIRSSRDEVLQEFDVFQYKSSCAE